MNNIPVVISGSSERLKGPVDRKHLKYGHKLCFTIFTQVVPTSRQQSHPEAASYSMSGNIPALRAGFSTNEDSHHSVLRQRTFEVECKVILRAEPIT
jgi:hypothetical protein